MLCILCQSPVLILLSLPRNLTHSNTVGLSTWASPVVEKKQCIIEDVMHQSFESLILYPGNVYTMHYVQNTHILILLENSGVYTNLTQRLAITCKRI